MRIKSIEQLEPIIKDLQLNLGMSGRVGFVENYRGQSHDVFKLENGIGRFKYRASTLRRKERKLFDKFIQKVKNGDLGIIQDPYKSKKYPFIEEWFYMYQAQHLGMKTRLMDWTAKWIIALLFAVCEEEYFGIDGQFWIFICPRKYIVNSGNLDRIYNEHPLEVKESYMINSPYYQDVSYKDHVAERRRTRQHGRFFIQSFDKAIVSLEEQPELRPHLHKYIIDGDSKERIREELGCITEDWVYYRQDDLIEEEVKKLNKVIETKCFWE